MLSILPHIKLKFEDIPFGRGISGTRQSTIGFSLSFYYGPTIYVPNPAAAGHSFFKVGNKIRGIPDNRPRWRYPFRAVLKIQYSTV